MTQFTDYFSALSLLRSAFRDLEGVFDKLNPRQPLTRTRLVAVSSDLECISELCGKSFLECAIWSLHAAERQLEVEENAPVLSTQEMLELQDYQIRENNNGKPLAASEKVRRDELAARSQRFTEELLAAFKRDEDCGVDKELKKAEVILKANVRAFLFSCRSYQDAIYALFLISKGKQPGQHSSMAKGVEKSEFQGAIADLPNYKDWFTRIRDLRNLSKVGATCSVGLGISDVKVRYDDARNDRWVKVGGNDFSFSDLSQSIEMSARITKLVVGS
ncbi:hypothetical protein [Phaeobacter inhibens]|uniref:hypothetical protein n=1 Tax=Phaeobacter inhibens TaxID=221822 RepID=UPI0021A6C7A7|nr:hypothetical protein [Phaeobacter inhibens]UWR63282.1 hypothetical protein K4L02_10955 [Phaeobacter inhibens]UWR71157.1 hypothetical protein K4L00_10665 [Phaeobacter inhibens]